MQLADAQRLISAAYNILSCNDEYASIKHYIANEITLHDGFWPLHKRLCTVKGNLRNALNSYSEISEEIIEIISEIKKLMERDKRNKQAKHLEKITEQKTKLLDKVKLLEKEEVEIKTLPQHDK